MVYSDPRNNNCSILQHVFYDWKKISMKKVYYLALPLLIFIMITSITNNKLLAEKMESKIFNEETIITKVYDIKIDQIKKINAYNTGNICACEHPDEMSLDEFSNERFFNIIMDWTEDDVLLY